MPREYILCVDDDKNVLTSIKQTLEDGKYKTIGAESGAEALRVFGQREKDIMGIFLDLKMAGIGGLEVMQEIRKMSDVPTIALSAYLDRTNLEECERVGFTGHMHKPFSVENLIRSANEFKEYAIKKDSSEKKPEER